MLRDAKKRNQYDQTRRLGSLGFGAGRRGTQPHGVGSDSGFTFDDLQGGFGNISDLFSSLFDLGKRGSEGAEPSGSKRSGRQKGQNVEYVVEIPFLTAVRGGKVSIYCAITEDCATCGVDGAKQGRDLPPCAE